MDLDDRPRLGAVWVMRMWFAGLLLLACPLLARAHVEEWRGRVTSQFGGTEGAVHAVLRPLRAGVVRGKYRCTLPTVLCRRGGTVLLRTLFGVTYGSFGQTTYGCDVTGGIEEARLELGYQCEMDAGRLRLERVQ